jgi:hypothetical protein
VFGVFEPTKEWWHILKQIGPPKWQWPVDAALAAQGSAIYNRPTKQGGCRDCHGIRPGEVRFLDVETWATTPLQDVGTDTKEYDILTWTATTGVLNGAEIPFITSPLKESDLAISVLTTSVLGSIIQNYVPFTATAQEAQTKQLERFRLPPALQDLKGAFHLPGQPSPRSKQSAPTTQYVFEARVMEGIWAAAPYLHNGSIPTLYDLLLPADQRPKAFKIGPAYDKVNVGLAIEQTKFDYTLDTTDCSDRNSGSSRCGHEFGTQLPPEEKKALLEYLKTL